MDPIQITPEDKFEQEEPIPPLIRPQLEVLVSELSTSSGESVFEATLADDMISIGPVVKLRVDSPKPVVPGKSKDEAVKGLVSMLGNLVGAAYLKVKREDPEAAKTMEAGE
jgi:hypothetical protein